MPVAKLRANSSPDAKKSEEGNDSLDTFVRQAIGKDPFLSFPRTGDNPVQWIQFLHALDQQADLSGWPFPSSLKVQMQKCDKCSREFCSPINYRRHIRVHRRSLNVDKESHKNRDLLGAFWDKLSLDEAREAVSFKDVTLENLPGSSLIRALTSFIRKPGLCILPQVYAKAGSALLDVIQARSSRIPISSLELFSILDDASEKTFLCAGTAESMQKYVFDGDAGKIGLEMKNLVACTSFLVEQKLVKAWLADKDAEALRCQKLLVEEEEAAQKRQAELLERKRQKKLRQKEQKAKELENGEKADFKNFTADTTGSPSAQTSSTPDASELCSDVLEMLTDNASSHLAPVQLSPNEEDVVADAQLGFTYEHSDSSFSLNLERQMAQGISHRHLAISRWQVPKSQRGVRNGFHASQHPQAMKLEPVQRHVAPRDSRAGQPVNGVKIWTRKPKPENLEERLQKKVVNQTEKVGNCEVIIGSIPVTLGSCTASQLKSDSLVEAQENCCTKHEMSKNRMEERPVKTEIVQGSLNRSTVRLWRPVSHRETRGPMPVQSGLGESGEEGMVGSSHDLKVPSESCLTNALDDDNEYCNKSHLEDSLVSSHAAKAFLAQRWKEAIASDHVKLVLTLESEPPGCPEVENNRPVVEQSSSSQRHSALGKEEPSMDNVHDSSVTGISKAMSKTKPEKGVKKKYIPKWKRST
ncbi:hypothetical protein NMG60_11022278 [Bertholletia excelsa]